MQGTQLAQACVQAHAEGEEQLAELLVSDSEQVSVVEEGEVFDQQGAYEPRAHAEYTQGHGSAERATNLFVHGPYHAVRETLVVEPSVSHVGDHIDIGRSRV